jgi:hypothetical protein
MPWIPELFSEPVVQQFKDRLRRESETVPFFDGVLAGEVDALIGSFAGEPELHHPVRGRIRGEQAFAAWVDETRTWLVERNVSIEDGEVMHTDGHGVGEAVLRVDGRVALPVGIATDTRSDGRIHEVRMYFSGRPLTGRHAIRPPLLQPDPGVRIHGVVGHFLRALADGDPDGIVSRFEPDGCVGEPAGAVHRGRDGLRDHYARLCADGGVQLETCVHVDGGRRPCAVEYNVVRWGRAELPPQAGLLVFVRGEGRKLAAVRSYDDVEPPATVTPGPDPR